MTTLSVRLDSKGRLSIPREVREEYGLEPGDTLFLQCDEKGVIRVAKAVNPFEALADHAVAEYRAGRTRDLRAVATKLGVDLNERGAEVSG